MSENKAAVQEVESVKALKIIQGAIAKAKDLQLVPTPSATGYSYFAGKKRLCKLLNTKRGIALEINVKLPADLAKVPGMESISTATAHKKHLGTMKHMYRSSDASKITDIIEAAIKAFRAEKEAVKAEEAKTEAPKTKETVTKDQVGDISEVMDKKVAQA